MIADCTAIAYKYPCLLRFFVFLMIASAGDTTKNVHNSLNFSANTMLAASRRKEKAMKARKPKKVKLGKVIGVRLSPEMEKEILRQAENGEVAPSLIIRRLLERRINGDSEGISDLKKSLHRTEKSIEEIQIILAFLAKILAEAITPKTTKFESEIDP